MDDHGARSGVARSKGAWSVWGWALIGMLLLSACESIVASGAPSQVEAPPDSGISAAVAHTATAQPRATETALPTVTPTVTPSPSPTPTPFRCPYLKGTTERGAFQSQAMGEPVRYLVHLPPCYADYPDVAFPVLYLLHGWPLSEEHWMMLGAARVADDWVSRRIAGPFILVMPGAGSDGLYVHSSGGGRSFEGMIVDELLPLIDGTYRTLRAREGRAIGGISRGGVWSLEIALRHQDLFGSVGGHSPALALNNPLPQYDPFLLVRNQTPQLRIYLDAGDLDWARQSTLSLYDLLVQVGADVRYETHEGGHVDALWEGGMLDYIAFYTELWPSSYDALPLWAPAAEAESTPVP